MSSSEQRFEKIGDIPLPRLMGRIVTPVDSGIEDLVRVLNGMGLITSASCEGHLDGERWPNPWVSIPVLNLHRLRPLEGMLGQFNRGHSVKWTTASNIGLRPRVSASNEGELIELQRSARSLAGFLFEKYLKLIP